MWGWRAIGAIFAIGGVVNLLGLGEDIPATLAQMAAENASTRLGPASALIASHAGFATGIAAGFMLLTGLAELAGGGLARPAGAGQTVMMLVFVALLHRAFPEVILADGLLALCIAGAMAADRRRAAA